ncbi:MAG: DUF1501 domain-containing protein [Acidobacteria bacterium]|nr:DUF1501 domain-containing protein [Acidobacteriota bacterium]
MTGAASADGGPGAGVKGGRAIGSTDEIGLKAVDDCHHVSDLHATIRT